MGFNKKKQGKNRSAVKEGNAEERPHADCEIDGGKRRQNAAVFRYLPVSPSG